MTSQEMLTAVRTIKENQILIDELDTENEALKDAIKAEMNTRNTDEIQVDVFKVKYKPVITNKFDSTAFKESFSDLYNRFLKKTECKRFTIS